MKPVTIAAALLWLADAPMAAVPVPDACTAANTRIVGPRTRDRPLPLLGGDAAHGFRPVCSVRWDVLSPNDQPLAVEACYRGSLLQIVNQVCPAVKGKLWVSARWVLTTADPVPDRAGAVACQHLETLALAATRGLPPACTPAGSTPSGSTPAAAPPAATPPAATPPSPAPPSPAPSGPAPTGAAPPPTSQPP